MAQQLLGSDAEVLASGDLAGNGKRQALVVNRAVANRPDAKRDAKHGVGPAIVFSRAAILEQRGAKWSELLLCDEYLKNTKGFLGGAPTAPTSSWRLEFVPTTLGGKVVEFDFTPLQPDGTGRGPTVVVRWNPQSNGYQSFDPATGRFLDEVTSLEPPSSELR